MEVLAAFLGTIVNIDLASPDNDCQPSINRGSSERQKSITTESTECQQSVNNLGCCILYGSGPLLRHLCIINVLAAFVGTWESDIVTAPVGK